VAGSAVVGVIAAGWEGTVGDVVVGATVMGVPAEVDVVVGVEVGVLPPEVMARPAAVPPATTSATTAPAPIIAPNR
jgi:hypothetical protein